MFFDDSVLSRGTGGNGTIETPGGHKLRVLISANGTREPQHVSPTPWAPAPSYGASSGQASSSHLQYSSSMPELGETAEPSEASERAPRADAQRLTTRLRPLEDREIDRDPLARFTHATPVPKLGALRLPERTSNKLLTDSFPAGFLARAKAAHVLEVSGDYDAATNPYGSRVLKPGFRFADALVGTARGRHTALDELPGAPSFGAVEYYSLPSPGGAFRRAPVSQLPLAQRVFDVPDLPKRSPRLLVDDRSLVVEDELDRRRGDDDDLGSARSQRSYAELVLPRRSRGISHRAAESRSSRRAGTASKQDTNCQPLPHVRPWPSSSSAAPTSTS